MTDPLPPEAPMNTSLAPPTEPPVGTRDVAVLTTENLSVWYGQSLALKEITIAIPRNRITALIGPSGCGKSTLLRCFNRMNDLIPGARMEGEIAFEGRGHRRPDVDAVALRRRIGMVFQKPNPFPKSIYQNVAWGARINGYRGDIDELVEKLAPPRGALGRGQGQAQQVGPRPLRRPAAAALHRPDPRRRARGHPHGRALLGARPDLRRPGSRT